MLFSLLAAQIAALCFLFILISSYGFCCSAFSRAYLLRDSLTSNTVHTATPKMPPANAVIHRLIPKAEPATTPRPRPSRSPTFTIARVFFSLHHTSTAGDFSCSCSTQWPKQPVEYLIIPLRVCQHNGHAFIGKGPPTQGI